MKTPLTFLFLFSGSVYGGDEEDLQEGWDAYDRKDYKTTLRLWLPLAEQGNAEAQVLLGMMYSNGTGVTQDYKEAVKWYRLSAEQGNASAQSNLGLMYDNGTGVPQDYKEAVKWYRLSAKQDDVIAQFNLGALY
jgi:TPR repeat protein